MSIYTQGQDDFLGIVKCIPNLRFSSAKEKKTRLTWYKINRYGHYAGELLAAFELLVILIIINYY